MTDKGLYYMGGARGGRKRNTTYYPGSRPNDSELTQARQALTRRFGGIKVSAGVGATGNTARVTDPAVLPPIDGWSTVHITVADNSSEYINLGVATGIAAIKLFVEVKRNHATPIREVNELRITQANGAIWMGREYERNAAGANPGVTITASLSGGDIRLTFATSNATPDATADIQILYFIFMET
jgi:hypothetical protein